MIIGRNEGERLQRCLASIAPCGAPIVYVDSGSTDRSVEHARARGALVHELDTSLPFTAARGRNAGLRQLLAAHPALEYVMFVDGDCEVAPTWPAQAVEFLDAHPRVAVVFGRRRERHPERSVYNRLCDIEWNTPIGERPACGGDAVMRVAALAQAGGYRDDLIAGEEPELCVRLRRAGWRIWRLDAEMTLHDANMLRFTQWWRRMLRAGYAYAQGAWLHGRSPERHNVAQTRRAWLWGLGIPASALIAAAVLGWPGLLPLAAYPLQLARLILRSQHRGVAKIYHPLFLLVSRFPEMLGAAKFQLDRLRRRQATLIEYK